MKKILIVYSDVILSFIFKRRLILSSNEILFSRDAKTAVEILNAYPIQLLITELSLPKMDGVELLAEVSCISPMTKIAFFLPVESTPNKQLFNQKLKELRSFYFMYCPSSSKDLIHFFGVEVLEVAKFQTLAVENIAPGDFLQLLAYQEKTCELEIENSHSHKKIQLYFEAGRLYDIVELITETPTNVLAFQAYLSDEINLINTEIEAGIILNELLTWKRIKIRFKSFDKKYIPRKTHFNLAELIKNASLSK